MSTGGEPGDLLGRFRRGDADACADVERWAREVVRSPRYGVAASDQPDLVQETLRQVWEQVTEPEFRLAHSLRALVHRIAMARCIDWLRRRRILVEIQDDLLREVPDPTARLEVEQQVSQLHRALGEIKPLCRDLVRWHFHEQKTYGEIAASTGRNESTLRVHMFNCLKALRALMQMGDHRG